MIKDKTGLFGVKYSNRDFTQVDAWGKNQFNSSFPIALTNYLASKRFENIYICLDNQLHITHKKISAKELYGIDADAEDLFFSFETPFSPYQQFVIGSLPRVDVVTQLRSSGESLRLLEIKLTALPDNSTCNLNESSYGSEIVIRPDTIVYLACSIIVQFKNNKNKLHALIGNTFENITDWTDGISIWAHIPEMICTIDRILLSIVDKQEPLLVQPVWKTNGKSPKLSHNCLDVFIWSNFAFSQLFLDVARGELSQGGNKVTRQIRTIIWLFKMLYDYAQYGQINHHAIIDELSYNTKNDKAFAVNGKITHRYMGSPELTRPRITKNEIKDIILGGGQNLLSPERRFDAIIFNSPELFAS